MAAEFFVNTACEYGSGEGVWLSLARDAIKVRGTTPDSLQTVHSHRRTSLTRAQNFAAFEPGPGFFNLNA